MIVVDKGVSMILKLSPDQIGEKWDTIKLSIELSIPPILQGGEIRMNNILDALLTDIMQCWTVENEQGELCAILTTTFMPDPGTRLISLFVYSIYGIKPLDINMWREGFSELRSWARSKGCCNIVAFTNVPKIIQIVKTFGGSANQVLVTIPIVGDENEDIQGN